MDTQLHMTPAAATRRSIENDLDRFLDEAAAATTMFRAAVEAYLANASASACWLLAKQISEQIRKVDHLQQKLETEACDASISSGSFPGLLDPLAGVTRLLREMRRQITSFAVESGFSGGARDVPSHLVADLQELTDEVCAAVDELVESCRPCMLLWGQPSCAGEELGVGWYESQADRLSMRLIQQIFADDTLDLDAQLRLAQLVEEIDRVADKAERVDLELRVSRIPAATACSSRDSH